MVGAASKGTEPDMAGGASSSDSGVAGDARLVSEPGSPDAPSHYRPQFDELRAVAVYLVVAFHTARSLARILDACGSGAVSSMRRRLHIRVLSPTYTPNGWATPRHGAAP